jgi:manganese/zinc/iron transport system substrate-binding protein
MFFDPSKIRRTRRGSGRGGSCGRRPGCEGRPGRGTALVIGVAAALAAACLAGCSPGSARTAGSSRPRILCTTTIVADLVREVAGDRAEVESLMAAGIDPHSYRATPRDADRLATADLVVAHGLRLEGKLADLLARLGDRVPVVAVADAVPPERLLGVGAGQFDPHVWFDAALWAGCAAPVAAALARIDPDGAAAYSGRAAAWAARLEALDAELRARLESIPPPRRVLVTAHDAFRYFGRAYGIEVVGVQGVSTESEAGLADINGLVELLVDRRIPAVFLETSVSDRNVAALVEGAAARGHVVTLGGRLYSDSLGAAGSGAETLAEALETNVRTIVAALAAPAADGG